MPAFFLTIVAMVIWIIAFVISDPAYRQHIELGMLWVFGVVVVLLIAAGVQRLADWIAKDEEGNL